MNCNVNEYTSYEELAKIIQYFHCKYFDEIIDENEIIGEFVNYADYKVFLEGLPLNEKTYSLFKYVVGFECCDDTYFNMVFDNNCSFENMKAEIIKDSELYYEQEDEKRLQDAKTKFDLYCLFVEPEIDWYGLDKYQHKN